MTQQSASGARPSAARCETDTATKVTKSLLGYGVLAGPLYVVVAAVQAFTRPGFDPARHDVSLLANGHLGWVQVANFLIVGLMVLAAATGMRRALRNESAGTWGPRLVAVYGLGLISAGLLRADPAFGFPPGTPAEPGATSWHGLGHLVAGGIGFLTLIAACFVFARRFARDGRRGWAAYSVATGVLFFAGFAGIATGSGSVGVTVAFTVAVLIAWAWLAAVSVRLYRAAGRRG